MCFIGEIDINNRQASGIVNMDLSPKINLRQIGITIKHAMKTNGETNETYTVLKPFDIEILLQLHLKGLTALEKMIHN